MMPSIASSLAVLICTLALTPSARADSPCNSDSKHGSMRQHPNATPIDYARYSWLTSENDQPASTVNHILVSLADQRLYAYHGPTLVAWSNVCSGAPGHDTPTGSFSISQKDLDHHSSLYENASMPFFLRLTDDGVGLHAGFLPGYPASHGCVRLPFGMAQELYQHVDEGTTVKIVSDSANVPVADDDSTFPPSLIHLAKN
jgi:lipoprotein-anchoring transpeptidase ErfK/SrfK